MDKKDASICVVLKLEYKAAYYVPLKISGWMKSESTPSSVISEIVTRSSRPAADLQVARRLRNHNSFFASATSLARPASFSSLPFPIL